MLVAALKVSRAHKFIDRFRHWTGLPKKNAKTPRATAVYTDTIAKLVVESLSLSKTFIAIVYIAQLKAKPNVKTMPVMDAFVEKSCLKTVTPTMPIITIKKADQKAQLLTNGLSSTKKINDIAEVHKIEDLARSVIKAGLI